MFSRYHLCLFFLSSSRSVILHFFPSLLQCIAETPLGEFPSQRDGLVETEHVICIHVYCVQ